MFDDREEEDPVRLINPIIRRREIDDESGYGYDWTNADN